VSRPTRILYPGAWYHVFSHGTGNDPVFETGEYGAAFLDVLAEVSDATRVEVHAYCLLTNGYHLLLRTPQPNLPQMMRQLNGQYAHWCRRDGRRDGPVFGRRYRSVLLDPDGWPLRVSRYVHLLPKERGLVGDPLLFRWSSLRAMGAKIEVPAWLHTSTLLKLAGGPNAYLNYVSYGVDAETAAFYSRQRVRPVLGQPRIPGTQDDAPAGKVSIDQIVRTVSAAFGLAPESLLEAKRGRGEQATPRAITMLLARSPGGHSLEDIAQTLNIQHVSTISVTVRRCRDRLQKDENLRDQVDTITRRLPVGSR